MVAGSAIQHAIEEKEREISAACHPFHFNTFTHPVLEPKSHTHTHTRAMSEEFNNVVSEWPFERKVKPCYGLGDDVHIVLSQMDFYSPHNCHHINSRILMVSLHTHTLTFPWMKRPHNLFFNQSGLIITTAGKAHSASRLFIRMPLDRRYRSASLINQPSE